MIKLGFGGRVSSLSNLPTAMQASWMVLFSW